MSEFGIITIATTYTSGVYFLPKSVSDAKAIQECFRNLGFQIQISIHGREWYGTNAIPRLRQAGCFLSEPGRVLLMYVSVHGRNEVENGKQCPKWRTNGLALQDTTEFSSILADHIHPKSLLVCFIDACFSGDGICLDPFIQGGKRCVTFTASSTSEYAYQSKKNGGLFTRAVIQTFAGIGKEEFLNLTPSIILQQIRNAYQSTIQEYPESIRNAQTFQLGSTGVDHEQCLKSALA